MPSIVSRKLRNEEKDLGKKPDQIEFFQRLHKRQKGKGECCDPRAQKVVEKYQMKLKEKRVSESESVNGGEESFEVPFDPQVWVEAIGGPKKIHVYGFRFSEEAESILGHIFASSTTKQPVNQEKNPEELETQIQAQVDARVDARMETLRAEMNDKMQQQLQQMLVRLQLPNCVTTTTNTTGDIS